MALSAGLTRQRSGTASLSAHHCNQMKPSHKKTRYATRSALQKVLVDLHWAAPAHREAMHRRLNAFIAGTARGRRDATIEPLQARPQSYRCFELHEIVGNITPVLRHCRRLPAWHGEQSKWACSCRIRGGSARIVRFGAHAGRGSDRYASCSTCVSQKVISISRYIVVATA